MGQTKINKNKNVGSYCVKRFIIIEHGIFVIKIIEKCKTIINAIIT